MAISSEHSPDVRGWVAWDPVEEERGEPLLEEDRGPGDQVADRLSLLLSSMPGKGKYKCMILTNP